MPGWQRPVGLLEETHQPPFGPSPPPLAGAELPSFRFSLAKAKTKVTPGGTAKEANVSGFPVSRRSPAST